MSHDEIDDILADLGRPTTVEQRLGILERLIAYWHGPLDPGLRRDEGSLRGFRLPKPLRWLYERGIDRSGALCRQNCLSTLDDLRFDDEYLVFYVENQAVYLWAIAAEKRGDAPGQLRFPFFDDDPSPAPVERDSDPPVWGRWNTRSDPWEREDVRLSEFLIQASLFEAIITAPHGASVSWGSQSLLDRVTAPLRPLPLGPWHWPANPTRFWSGGGAFVVAGPNGPRDPEPSYSIWVGAKDEEPLGYLKAIVDPSWEHRTF